MTNDFYSNDATRRSEMFTTVHSKETLGQRLAHRVNTLARYVITPVAMAAVAVSISMSTEITVGFTPTEINIKERDPFIEDIERRWSTLRSFGDNAGYDMDRLLASASKLLDSPRTSGATDAELEAIVEDEIKHIKN